MSRKGFTAVYANLHKTDYARIRQMLGPDASINDWLRGLISADLEESGEAPLTSPRDAMTARKKNL